MSLLETGEDRFDDSLKPPAPNGKTEAQQPYTEDDEEGECDYAPPPSVWVDIAKFFGAVLTFALAVGAILFATHAMKSRPGQTTQPASPVVSSPEL